MPTTKPSPSSFDPQTGRQAPPGFVWHEGMLKQNRTMQNVKDVRFNRTREGGDEVWAGSTPKTASWGPAGDNRILDSVVQAKGKAAHSLSVMGTTDPAYNYKPQTYKNWWGGETKLGPLLRDMAFLAVPGGAIRGASALKGAVGQGVGKYLRSLPGSKMVDPKDAFKNAYQLLPRRMQPVGQMVTNVGYHASKMGGIASDAAMGVMGNVATPLSYTSKYLPALSKIGLVKALNKFALEPTHRFGVGSKVMEGVGSEQGLGTLAKETRIPPTPLY